MLDYRLSEAAKEDLIRIAQYGDEHFSMAQSDRYRDQIKLRFSLLAEQPMLYPAVEISALDTGAACAGCMQFITRLKPRAWK